jgi:hypothetical protein
VTTATWDAVLDALEADLAQFNAVLEQGVTAPATPAFEPPAGLGPLPAHLAPRATDLGAAYEAAIERAEAGLAAVRAELAALPRPRIEEPRARRPAFIDFQS